MHAALQALLLASALAAPPLAGSPAADDAPEVAACKDARATCRETCTLEYGTSAEARGRLIQCLQRCDAEQRRCEARAGERAAHRDGG